MTAPEFSRLVRLDTLGAAPQTLAVAADEPERTALAQRFGLVAIDALGAEVALSRKGDDVHASGRLAGRVTQSCVASSTPVESALDAPFKLVFSPQPQGGDPDEEIELEEGELDSIFYEGGAVDIGEAIAQTLLLNLDPYPRAPGAEEVLKQAGVKGEAEAGPFAALAALRDKLPKRP